MLTSVGTAPPTKDTIQKLRAKHPPASVSVEAVPVSCPPLQISTTTLRSVLRSAPRGSSPGCDGWRFEHFRVLLQDDEAMELLARICNLFLAGMIPAEVALSFAGARLIALRKNQYDVRPIAVGSVFRRLVAKVACNVLKADMSAFFAPFQFRVATPGGTEHLTRLLQLTLAQHPDWIILKTDAKNAFNSISRQAFLEGVAEHFPSLYHFVASCYLNSPSLCLLTPDGVDCIQSSEGVQQGDPLGPFLFSLALHPCLKMAAEKCEQGFVVSYLDDAMVAGPKTDILAAYDCLQQEMKAIGLHIRPDKCEALSMIPVPDWSLPIPFTTDGMQVLGCPVGSDLFVQRQCVKFTQNRLPFLKKLRCMRNLQSAMLLLRYCGVPTITHLLRSAAPHNVAEAAAQHDLDILDTFQSIIGISATVQQKSQISLPISLGGFGLLSAASASPCAFLGSWASTLAFLPERLPQFPSAPLDINVTPPDLVHHCLELLKKSCSAISEVLPLIEALPEKALKLQSRLTRC